MRYLLAMLALATLCLLSTKLLYSQDLLPAPKPPAPPKAFLQLSDQDANRGSTTRISLSDQPASENEDAPDDKDIEQDSEGESQTNSEGEGRVRTAGTNEPAQRALRGAFRALVMIIIISCIRFPRLSHVLTTALAPSLLRKNLPCMKYTPYHYA